jgi:hypothetical protein
VSRVCRSIVSSTDGYGSRRHTPIRLALVLGQFGQCLRVAAFAVRSVRIATAFQASLSRPTEIVRDLPTAMWVLTVRTDLPYKLDGTASPFFIAVSSRHVMKTVEATSNLPSRVKFNLIGPFIGHRFNCDPSR